MNEHVTSVAAGYDVERLRADFPILSKQVYGKPLVYLDNAASAQKPRTVIERLTEAYENEYANVHRGLHYLANAATEAFEVARERVRAFLNAGSHEEIVFTRNATEAINLVASSFGLDHIKLLIVQSVRSATVGSKFKVRRRILNRISSIPDLEL